jgi:hypothetical protein
VVYQMGVYYQTISCLSYNHNRLYTTAPGCLPRLGPWWNNVGLFHKIQTLAFLMALNLSFRPNFFCSPPFIELSFSWWMSCGMKIRRLSFYWNKGCSLWRNFIYSQPFIKWSFCFKQDKLCVPQCIITCYCPADSNHIVPWRQGPFSC